MPAQTVIKLRRGTLSQWASANPVLAAGEMGIETDTNKSKFGNGTTAWNLLPYSLSAQANNAPGSVTLIGQHTGGVSNNTNNQYLVTNLTAYAPSRPENQLLFVGSLAAQVRPGSGVSSFTEMGASLNLRVGNTFVAGEAWPSNPAFGGVAADANVFLLDATSSLQHGVSGSGSSFFLAPAGVGFAGFGVFFTATPSGNWQVFGTYSLQVYEVAR